MMTDVACFCGCLYSFDGRAGACPSCGEYATVRTGPALGCTEGGRPREQGVLGVCQDRQNGQTAGSFCSCDRALIGEHLDGIPFPVLRPDEVAGAALAGLRLGEVVCVPSLHELSMIDTLSQAQLGLFLTAANSELANRYQPGPRQDGR
jgi:hypothetical protein